MLGVPSSPGFLGWALLLSGVGVGALLCALLRRHIRAAPLPAAAASVCLAFTAAALPYVAWRFAEDLRVTTKLAGYDAAAAGPIQAYLPGYLVDGAPRLIPRTATYATAVGPSIPWAAARAAFPSLALQTLFPRRSVAEPRKANYVLTWGIQPARVAPVDRVWVIRPRLGDYAAIRIGRVRR